MSQATQPPSTEERLANEVIRASAGSGKTYQLSNRYLRLIFAGAAPDTILATTFTRKAAGEILDRILSRLAAAASDETLATKLGGDLGIENLTRAACLAKLEKVTRNLHRLRISTLDALFMKIAGSCSLELQLPPGWRIVEETVAARLRDRATQLVLSQGKLTDLLTLLNLLTKGEASRSISQLVSDAVDNLYSLWQESEEAAWHRVPRSKTLGDAELAAVIEQIRGAELPKHKSIAKARDGDIAQAEAADWVGFLKTGIAKKVLAGENSMYGKTLDESVLTGYDNLLSHAKGVLLGQLADQTESAWKLLSRFDSHYQQLQAELGALRFNDITRVVAKSQSSVGSRLALRMGGGIDHMLLDEFQDTSINQWHALRPLAERAATPEPDRSFFCVGDAKQAIYRWRGGEAEIFDALDKELPAITERPLNKSYRSAPAVIDCVNVVFDRLLQHDNLGDYVEPIRKWLGQYTVHETDRTSLAGYVTLETSAEFPPAQSTPPEHWAYVAQRIKELSLAAPHASIGVLVRKNDTVARLIYELKAIDVAASEEGGNPLIDSPAVELILSLLRLADHPGDSRCWFHVSSSPLGAALGYGEHHHKELANKLAAQVRSDLFNDGYGACVERWSAMLAPHTARRDWNRLEQLTEAAFRYDSEATLRPHEFIELVEAQRVADPTADRIRVMTVHQSKGLQFDSVVLPELDSRLRGQPPSLVTNRPTPTSAVDTVMYYTSAEVQALLPPELQKLFENLFTADLHESMCLLYVAMTRAIHSLHMIIPPQSPEKKQNSLPKTFAGLLRAALTDGEPLPAAEVVYQSGNDRWMHAPGSPTGREADDKPTLDPLPATISLAAAENTPPRIRESVSPSSLEGDRRINVAQFFRTGRESILLRGTVIHAWFEQIAWLDDPLPSDATLLQVAAEVGATSDDATRWLSEFHAMVKTREVAAPLNRDFYTSHPTLGDQLPSGCGPRVFAEQRLFVREEENVLEGFIDRLVVLFDGNKPIAAEVLDFKTDGIEDDKHLKEKVRHYRPQIEAYRRAVSKMWKLPPEAIASRLIFVERKCHVAVS